MNDVGCCNAVKVYTDKAFALEVFLLVYIQWILIYLISFALLFLDKLVFPLIFNRDNFENIQNLIDDIYHIYPGRKIGYYVSYFNLNITYILLEKFQ